MPGMGAVSRAAFLAVLAFSVPPGRSVAWLSIVSRLSLSPDFKSRQEGDAVR